ncbi:diguanylate cyclase [Kineococcus sp. NPDC059986]|uniref:diguanylate cyclase domain-containing protein n=1 Tax=Kineococcus sp. NPDC059986 TaxID=3155538 RepID=UPI003450A0D1
MPSDSGRLVEAPGEPALLRGPWRRRAVFVVLFSATVLLGRSATADGAHLAIVWPAAAVGLLWLAGSPGGRHRLLDGFLLVLLTVGLRVLTGMPVAESVLLGLAALVQAVTGARSHRRLEPAGFRLSTPAHLRSLAVSASLGALASSPVAAAAFAVAGVPVPLATGQWLLRTGVSTFLVLAVVLRTAERRPDAPGSTAGLPERAAILTAAVLTYGLTFWLLDGAPVAFLVIPVAVWVALRRTTTAATVHVLLAAAVVVAATWAGRGPWADLPPDVQAVCAEAFTGVLGFLTLVLALHRDESVDNARHAAEQADLLSAVFSSISDAVCVFDARGDSILRNPAAERLLGGSRATRGDWGQRIAFAHPDGTPHADGEVPIARALRGESVDGEDLLYSSVRHPEGVLLNASLRPLPHVPGVPWSGGVVAAFHDVTEVRAAAERVAQAHELLTGVLAAATEHAIVAVDTSGTTTVFNEGAERMLGWTAAEVVGTDSAQFFVAEELRAAAAAEGLDDPRQLFFRVAREGARTARFSFRHRDGSTFPVSLTTTALVGADGAVQGFIGMATDISELEDSEALFRSALQAAPVGIALVRASGAQAGRLQRVNRSLCGFTGRTEEELLGTDVGDVFLGGETCDELFADVLSGFVPEARLDLQIARVGREPLRVEVSATLVRRRGGEVTLLCLVEDVTERLAVQAQLRHQALHDALTGLPNRLLFLDRLEHAVVAARRGTAPVGLLYVDLDGFKAVNDTAGHDAGDDLLVQVAGLLGSCVRPGDTVARLGGDEFAIVCSGTSGEEDLVAIGTRVLDALRAPLTVRGHAGVGHQAVVGASIGVRWCAGEGSAAVPVEELLRDADEAMYAAKRAGKGRVVVHRGAQGTAVVGAASHLSSPR